MLLDIMSPYNQIPVNVKAINVFGLGCATYWATLADIFPRVISKKYDALIQSGGYFTVDREYIKNRTSLDQDYQYACDLTLSRAGVLAINPVDPNSISISMDRMFEILAESDAKVLEKIKKQAKIKKTDEAAAKRKGKIANFTAFTSTLSHTPEVQQAYELWVESIIEGKKGNLTKGVIQIFHDTLTEYTKDPAQQVKIIRDAAASGYTNVSWVLPKVKAYTPATRIEQQQKTFAGVDTSETF